MLLEKGEFVGASIPEHLFQAPQGCRECRQPAKFTVLVTGAWGAQKGFTLQKPLGANSKTRQEARTAEASDCSETGTGTQRAQTWQGCPLADGQTETCGHNTYILLGGRGEGSIPNGAACCDRQN